MIRLPYSDLRRSFVRPILVAVAPLAIGVAVFVWAIERFGSPPITTFVPSYHGFIVLAVALLCSVCLGFAFLGLRVAEISSARLDIAERRARLQAEVSKRAFAKIAGGEEDIIEGVGHDPGWVTIPLLVDPPDFDPMERAARDAKSGE